MQKLKIKIISAIVDIPKYATSGSSGMDLQAAIEAPYSLPPGEFTLIPNGIKCEIPEGYEAQVRPRSGLAAKAGIGILNAPGTIDSDYRGEIKTILFNFSNKPYTFQPGERIAQMIICKVYQPSIEAIETISKTKRGAGGFGHTGK